MGGLVNPGQPQAQEVPGIFFGGQQKNILCSYATFSYHQNQSDADVGLHQGLAFSIQYRVLFMQQTMIIWGFFGGRRSLLSQTITPDAFIQSINIISMVVSCNVTSASVHFDLYADQECMKSRLKLSIVLHVFQQSGLQLFITIL